VDEAILVACLDLLHTSGYSALTMEAVAEHAGIGKNTLYRRYPSKIALISAAALRERETAGIVPDTGNIRDDLTLLLRNAMAILGQTAWGQVIAGIAIAAAEDEEVASARETFWRERAAAVRDVVDRGIDRGELRADTDPQLLYELVLGPVYFRFLVTGTPLKPELADEIVEEVMNGAGR
jgi:AcrR family transcriptional regulator